MTDSTGSLPPAGWYPDPYGAPFDRWWDGAGWTAHTNTPVPETPAEPAAPAVAQPVTPEPAVAEPVFTEPVAAEPVFTEPVASTPPPLEEPPVATTGPFSGFASPAEPTAYEAPVVEQQQPYEPTPATTAWQPAAYEQPTAEPTPAPFSFGQQEPVAQTDPFSQPAMATTPAAASSAFDFGFNDIIAGGTQPASAAAESGGGDDGLFGSWEPDEYVEPPRNSSANAGLALGVVSFFLSAVAGLPGLILSALGLRRSAAFAAAGEGPVGRTKAVAGLALSVVGSVVSAAVILWAVQSFVGGNATTTDTAADGSSVDAADLTQNGGIPLEIGDTGTIALTGSDAAAIQFTVTAITPNFACTAAGAAAPANGQFVAVAMNFTLAADYLDRMEGATPLRMNESDWIGYLADEDGTQVVNTEAGTSCIPASEQFPAEFEAGTNASGTIVLDMATDIASISWGPSGVTDLDAGLTRWEWDVVAG